MEYKEMLVIHTRLSDLCLEMYNLMKLLNAIQIEEEIAIIDVRKIVIKEDMSRFDGIEDKQLIIRISMDRTKGALFWK